MHRCGSNAFFILVFLLLLLAGLIRLFEHIKRFCCHPPLTVSIMAAAFSLQDALVHTQFRPYLNSQPPPPRPLVVLIMRPNEAT